MGSGGADPVFLRPQPRPCPHELLPLACPLANSQETGEADGLVEVSVSDTGVGIAPEDQEAVFEEFRQVGTAEKKVEGTGLGLTLCRKFVELHGGKIWVKSELGAGSTFTFTIPVPRGE
jgi:signal transduction histidine kinase